jgi:hypothetical protein
MGLNLVGETIECILFPYPSSMTKEVLIMEDTNCTLHKTTQNSSIK